MDLKKSVRNSWSTPIIKLTLVSTPCNAEMEYVAVFPVPDWALWITFKINFLDLYPILSYLFLSYPTVRSYNPIWLLECFLHMKSHKSLQPWPVWKITFKLCSMSDKLLFTKVIYISYILGIHVLNLSIFSACCSSSSHYSDWHLNGSMLKVNTARLVSLYFVCASWDGDFASFHS